MPQRTSPGKDIHEEKVHAYAEALRLNEAILDATGLAIVITAPDGLITGFNGAAENLLRYKASEVVGKSTAIIFHDMNEVARRGAETSGEGSKSPESPLDWMIRNARIQRTPDYSEWTFLRKDGSRFNGSLTLTALRDGNDVITGYASIISDISAQTKIKEQLQFSNQKFHLLAENIPGAIYLCNNDASYSVIFINDQIENITGFPKEDFYSGKISISDLFHPDDRQSIHDTVDQAVSERKSYQLLYRVRHTSGEWRWVDETGVGLFEGDKLVMLEGFLQDITLQRDAEERLRKVAEENLRFFNSPVNLNALVDFKLNLLRISPSWTKVLGWTEDQLKAEPILHFIHPEDVGHTESEVKSLAQTGQVHTFENRLRRSDGSYRWLLWAIAPDPVKQLVYASAIDISERKKSEENILDSKSNLEGITLQLQEQNRRLDEFAHIISHNLRAPVNNIQALINLLDDRSEITDYKLIFDKLKNVAKNLSETMNELMDTLKAKTQTHVDLTEIRFKEVLDKVVQSLEGELIVAQASVTFDFNEAPVIRYSKPYLESIFQNLLTNAVKYRSPDRKPCIHFRSLMKDNHLELQVTDNGQGIDLEKFGDKLFGLHKTFHHHQEARGVGLFLVKTQIEALGGSIRVESEVDKGTTFTIRFN